MYFEDKPDEVKKNASIIIDYAKNHGITNPITIASILAVIGKESGFTPIAELSYKNTSVLRLRSLFSYRLANLTDEQIDTLKKNDKAFYEQVYGKQWTKLGLGNKIVGDGYTYRGRGFNGITGRYLYDYFSKLTGIDFINNPNLLNVPEIAGKVAVEYFKYVLNTPRGKEILKKYYNNPTGDLNSFKTSEDSINAFLHSNAGINYTKTNVIDNDSTGGVARAKKIFPDMLKFLQQIPSVNIEDKKKNNNLIYILFGLGLLGLTIIAFNTNNQKNFNYE
jgi:predicted chitinase